MVWAKYGVLICAMALGVAVAMMALDGYLRGAPEAMIGAALALGAMGLLSVRFLPVLAGQEAAADTASDAVPDKDRDALVSPRSPDATSVRLLPRVQAPGNIAPTSWVGGLPRLPSDAGWPELDGTPARFLAQIGCAALPSWLWDGLGPRQGALAIFHFAPTPEGVWPVRVLHLEGDMIEAHAPEGVTPQPGWSLDIVPEGAEIDSGEGPSPDWQRLHAVDLGDPAWQPFDWTSASILLGGMKDLLEQAAGPICSTNDRQAYAGLLDTARRIADLACRLRQVRSSGVFTPELRTEMIEEMSKLTVPVPGEEAIALTAHPCMQQAYFSPFERHCRYVHSSPSAVLPEAQRALFEPLWAHNARHEVGAMGKAGGNDPDATAPDDAVLLLELPSSELLGWTFDAGRSIRVYVTRRALADGDFTEAWATVTA